MERLKIISVFVTHLAASMPKKTEISTFMAKRVAAKDVFGTKISTNSTCYQTI